MADSYYVVAIEGIDAFKDLDKLGPAVQRYAKMAVNKTLTRTRTAAARSMERQINFPQGYLTGDDGRLSIAQFASDGNLTGIIRGRDKPTSLARFVSGGATPGKKVEGGVLVEVDPGVAKRMPSAFAIRLKNNNIGLAYRTENGQPPSIGAKKISENLYLLYGPSVSQVFNKTREELVDDAEAFMAAEFNRLIKAAI